MYITVHHYNNGQSHADFRCRHHHDKKYKDLSVGTGCSGQVTRFESRVHMHFGKGHEEQVHGIQHEFYAHEYDDRIAAGKYPHYANAEQGNRQDDIIKYRHIVHLEGG